MAVAGDARGAPSGCVVCVGVRERGDDGVGPLVADEIRRTHPEVDVRECRDPFDLLDVVADAGTVVVVDAARVVDDRAGSTAVPGSVHIVADSDQARTSLGFASTHGFGPAEVLALADSLGGARRAVTLVAVVGEHFDVGSGASDAVESAVPAAAEQAVSLLAQETDLTGEA